MTLTVVQVLPALEVGGVEKGTLEIAKGLVAKGHRSIVISKHGRLVKQLLDQGSEHVAWAIGEKSLLTLRYVRRLRRLLLANNADIVHARSRLPAWITYLAWRGMTTDSRPRFMTTVHGAYSVNAYSKIMTRGEHVIAISAFIKQYVTDNYLGIDESRLTVIPRGVCPAEFVHGYKPNADWFNNWQRGNPQLDNKFIITLPARMTRRKGATDFVDIMHALKVAKLPVAGIIVGGADPHKHPFLSEIKEKIRILNLQEDIQFIGHRDDLKQIMSISNIVLSLAKKPEPFGRVTLEALSLGVPVVAYDHGGSSEILNALFAEGLVAPNDVDAATKKIVALYQKTATVKNNDRFTLQAMVDKTIALYELMATKTSC